jgi:hypothetical protein
MKCASTRTDHPLGGAVLGRVWDIRRVFGRWALGADGTFRRSFSLVDPVEDQKDKPSDVATSSDDSQLTGAAGAAL